MARNKIEMNITEEKAYNLVCKKESLGSLEFELLQLYLSICVVITVTLIVLILTKEINEFQGKIGIFIIVILCCLPYICKKIKIYTLKDDNEYQLAKQILKKYKEKVKKENLKIELKETFKEEHFEEEQEKSDKIKEFKKYLNEENLK